MVENPDRAHDVGFLDGRLKPRKVRVWMGGELERWAYSLGYRLALHLDEVKEKEATEHRKFPIKF